MKVDVFRRELVPLSVPYQVIPDAEVIRICTTQRVEAFGETGIGCSQHWTEQIQPYLELFLELSHVPGTLENRLRLLHPLQVSRMTRILGKERIDSRSQLSCKSVTR